MQDSVLILKYLIFILFFILTIIGIGVIDATIGKVKIVTNLLIREESIERYNISCREVKQYES
jgi:hypothetical protein